MRWGRERYAQQEERFRWKPQVTTLALVAVPNHVCQTGTCPIGSTNKPLYELKHLIAMLEREEEAKRQREERKNMAA